MANTRLWTGRMLRMFAVAAMPVITLTLFATLSIFAGNPTEFSSAYLQLLIVVAPYAAALVLVLAIPGLVMTAGGRTRYETFLCALAVLLWLQGNILVWDYGVFDGSSIDWLDGVWRGVLDSLVWVAVLLLAVYGYQRFNKAFLVVAVASILIQTAAASITLSGNSEVWQARDIAVNFAGREAAMRFSTTRNIVHIVMDGFQSDIFASILADTSERDFKRELRGFTYFDQHLGAYPFTQLTVPAMLSSKLFHNEVPVDEFVEQSLRGPTITNSAAGAGFEVDIMAPVPLKNVYTLGDHANAYGITTSGHVSARDLEIIDAARIVDLALFRVMPHFGKALVHRDELWVFQAKVQSSSYLHIQYFSDLAFLSELAAEMTVDRDAPVYKLIHVMLSHRPFVGNERCEFNGRKSESREAVITHAQCGFVRVLNVLQRMKDLGIYDSSLIVLMADHGAWIPIENFASSNDISAQMVAMATPMLAVKPANAKQAFQVSSVPTSIVDVPATIADLAGFEGEFGGESVFRINSDAARARHHLTYGYGMNPDSKGYLFPMQEWIINGNPYKSESWRRGTRYHSPD